MRHKKLRPIYWQGGAGQKPLRLIVVAPIPYRAPGRRGNYYREPAYLLSTDLKGTARELLQPYFDRWQIGVKHREEKDSLGVGQAHVRSAQSVPRQPAFVVAAYSAFLLAGLLAFDPTRTDAYAALPSVAQKGESSLLLGLGYASPQRNDRKQSPTADARNHLGLENSRR